MRSAAWFLLVALVILGCGRMHAPKSEAWSPATTAPTAPAGDSAARDSTESGKSAQPTPEAMPRKIIYTATVELVVERFDAIPSQVEAMAAKFGGFVAQSSVSGSPGQPRRGHWSIRVPVENYSKLLAAAEQLGEVSSATSAAQDVSEEYYDVEARIRNDKRQEERLLKLLDEETGKLEEVLQVERELGRVRGQIEQSEGRLRVLSNLTALSTVNLQVEEIKDYSPAESATYVTRVRRAWNASLANLATTAQVVSIALVALAPWLGVLLIPMVLVGLAARSIRAWRRPRS